MIKNCPCSLSRWQINEQRSILIGQATMAWNSPLVNYNIYYFSLFVSFFHQFECCWIPIFLLDPTEITSVVRFWKDTKMNVTFKYKMILKLKQATNCSACFIRVDFFTYLKVFRDIMQHTFTDTSFHLDLLCTVLLWGSKYQKL